MNKTDIKKISDEVIKIQEETIEKLKINIADDVSNVIEYLANLDGKIIITGIGIPCSNFWVEALKALQNSIIFTPFCPSAGPTGGDGLA